MNRDIVSRLVKRKQSRRGRLKEKLCVCVDMRDRQHREKQFNIRRKEVTERREAGSFYLSSLS